MCTRHVMNYFSMGTKNILIKENLYVLEELRIAVSFRLYALIL